MNKNIYFFLILFLINHCSFDTKSGIWTQEKKLSELNEKKENIKELFQENIFNENEFNKDLVIQINNNKKTINTNQNNLGISNLSLKLDKLFKYKFSKIENFDQYQPEISFYKNDVIFFDNKGSILRFNDQSKLLCHKSEGSNRRILAHKSTGGRSFDGGVSNEFSCRFASFGMFRNLAWKHRHKSIECEIIDHNLIRKKSNR